MKIGVMLSDKQVEKILTNCLNKYISYDSTVEINLFNDMDDLLSSHTKIDALFFEKNDGAIQELMNNRNFKYLDCFCVSEDTIELPKKDAYIEYIKKDELINNIDEIVVAWMNKRIKIDEQVRNLRVFVGWMLVIVVIVSFLQNTIVSLIVSTIFFPIIIIATYCFANKVRKAPFSKLEMLVLLVMLLINFFLFNYESIIAKLF